MAAGPEARPPEFPAAPREVDHLVYVASDLGQGMREIERRLGVRPAPGGRHPEYGTRNALVALGAATYLEVIAPDPELPRPERGRPFGLEEPDGPRLATWALRDEALETRAARAGSAGLKLGVVRSGSRRQPDGTLLTWRLTDLYAMPMDGAVPFLIAWGSTPHPAGGAPAGGALAGLRIEHPDPAAVRAALSALGVTMAVERAPRMRLAATIRAGTRHVELR